MKKIVLPQSQKKHRPKSSAGARRHKGFFKPPVPAKPNILYSRGKFVDMVCWTVGYGPGFSLEPSKKVNYLEQCFWSIELSSSRQRSLDQMNTKCKQSSLSAAGQLYASKPWLQVVYFFWRFQWQAQALVYCVTTTLKEQDIRSERLC